MYIALTALKIKTDEKNIAYYFEPKGRGIHEH